MLTLTDLPQMKQLESLAAQLAFPTSAAKVVQAAKRLRASSSVINFYADFADEARFMDIEDLLVRSEQVLMMANEQADQPWELFNSPQD